MRTNCGNGRVVLRRRGKKEDKTEGKKREKKERREKSGKRKTNSESARTSGMGEGAFSDEIRSRGRSEFGYLIRERGVRERGNSGNRDARGCAAPVSILVSFSPAASLPAKWDYAGSRTSNGALFHPPPDPSDPPSTFLLPTSCWDELTIDRIDTVAAGEPRVCRLLGTRVSPAAVASIFLAKLHPSPSAPPTPRSRSPSSGPRANAYVVKPFFHYEIVTA